MSAKNKKTLKIKSPKTKERFRSSGTVDGKTKPHKDKTIYDRKNLPDEDAESPKQKLTSENTELCNFVKCVLTKRYAEANKYLHTAVENKLLRKMEQELETPYSNNHEEKILKNIFSEEVQEILTEDTLNAIEAAFNERVQLSVDAALLEQDEMYADKLSSLLTVLDKDRAGKLEKLLEAVDKKNASKLVKIVRLYERAGVKNATTFKDQVVDSVSAYLDEYLEEAIDTKDFKQAVKNTSAFRVLDNLRNVLAVDSTLMDESVKTAVIDGNTKMTKLEADNAALTKQLKSVKESYNKIQVTMLLENKTANLPESKKNFIRKALADKSLQFIKENFDYTLRLFENQEKSKLQTLREEATKNRPVKPDIVPTQKVVVEKVNNHDQEYLDVLSRTKGSR